MATKCLLAGEIIVDDPEYEIHPLDRDYSAEETNARYGKPIEFDAKLRIIGTIVFAVGFAMLFLAAIVLGTFGGSGLIESIASGVHRFGMVLILIGGVTIIVAYRLPYLKELHLKLPDGSVQWKWSIKRSFSALVIWNVVALVAITLLIQLMEVIPSFTFYYLAVNLSISFVFAFFTVVAIWHTGVMRAYAVGVLAAMVPNAVSAIFVMTNFWGSERNFLLFCNVLFVLATGVICAAYVRWLESVRAEQQD